jgi:hypothetical protein
MPNYDDLAQALASEGAAFGVFPQMGGRRRLQDAEAAKNIPIDILRGIVSTGLGTIPSGIKLLSDIRNAGRDDRPSAEIPGGIDYWLDKLPLKGEAPVNTAAAQLGSMLPINPAPAYRALGNVGKATTSLLGNELARGMYGNEGLLANVIPTAMKPKQIFIGENAKTWNKDAAQIAVEMERAGAKPKDIWTSTGTFRSVDGKLRQEINDKNSRITEKVHQDIMSKHYFNDPMSSALTHEQLYQAYPELRDINTTITAWEQPKGSFSRLRNEIEASGPSSMHQRSTALHELQHAVQEKEKFAQGGSPQMFKPHEVFTTKALEDSAILDKMMSGSNLNQLEAQQHFEKLFNRKPSQGAFAALERVGTGKDLEAARDASRLSDNPLESYRRIAGEAEARAVQKRRNLTDEERRATFPYQSYDVPINELIVRK